MLPNKKHKDWRTNMIKILKYNKEGSYWHTDNRPTVDTISGISWADAIQLNEDETYERVRYILSDDAREYNNVAIIDATKEQLEHYRKLTKRFQVGDEVKIVEGRKMKGEIKTIKDFYEYHIEGLYGKGSKVNYVVFTDGTKVQRSYVVNVGYENLTPEFI